MTLLTTVQQVCPFIGVDVPDSIFSGLTSDRTKQELLALANEMARRLAYDTRDWTMLKITHRFDGDGSRTLFTLPANFLRLPISSNVWRSTSTQAPMRFIPDTDEWARRRLANETDAWGEWTIAAGAMLIYPAMGVGVSATFVYIDRNCVTLAGGGVGPRFMADGDSYRLDERLLELGMVWQWKAHKGSPYAEDMGTYGDALTMAMGFDSPAPVIVGRMPISANATIAYPWAVPT